MIAQMMNAMVTMLLAKFMLNDMPHAAGIIGSEQEKALTDQYGVWATQMGKRFCPINDWACIEEQARRFYTRLRAGGKAS